VMSQEQLGQVPGSWEDSPHGTASPAFAEMGFCFLFGGASPILRPQRWD